MDNLLFQNELKKKEDNVDLIVEMILQDLHLVRDTVYGVSSADTRVRYKCAKTLRMLSERKPAIFYPYFDFFEKLLGSDKNIIKWNAIDIIANLTEIDTEKKFEKVFDRFYGLLDEGSLITAGHIVDSSGKIANVKHNLRERITERLLSVEDIPLPTEECRSILAGKVILAFGQYINHIRDKDAVITFIKRKLNSNRSATRKKAEKLLEKLCLS